MTKIALDQARRRSIAIRGGVFVGVCLTAFMLALMGDFSASGPGVVQQLVLWSLVGLLNGAIFAGVQVRQMNRTIERGDGSDLEPHHAMEMAVGASPDEIFRFLRDELADSTEYDVLESSGDFHSLKVRRKAVAPLFGEHISIAARGQGNSAAVRISSQPVLPTVMVGSGRSRSNVHTVADLLLDRFGVEEQPGPDARERQRANQGSRRAPGEAE